MFKYFTSSSSSNGALSTTDEDKEMQYLPVQLLSIKISTQDELFSFINSRVVITVTSQYQILIEPIEDAPSEVQVEIQNQGKNYHG